MKVRKAGATSIAALVTAGACALLLVAVIGSAQAATSTKFYDAAITWPASVSAGGTATFTLELKNNSASTQTLGSADFWVPPGWATASVETPSPTSSDGHSWTVGTQSSVEAPDGTSGPAFTFRANTSGDALTPGAHVRTTVKTTVSCTTGEAAWQIQAKQANSFSGPPGNNFLPLTVLGLTGTVGAGGGDPDHLAFTTQPGNAGVAPATLPQVKVTVYDSCGNVAIGASSNVSLALVQPDDTSFGGGGTLGGGTSATPTAGIASFSTLTVDAQGQGYSLDASYPGLATVRSDPFSVFDFYGDCASGCGTNDDTTGISIVATGGTFGLSLNSDNQVSCGGHSALGSAFTVVPPAGHTAYDILFVLTINKKGLQGVGASNIGVCKNSGPGTALVLLGKCPKKGPITAPCIVSQTSSNAGDAQVTIRINSTDPGGTGFS